jgi:serine/threonine protein kinase
LDAAEPYLILEYSELGSLQQYVKNRRDWRQVVRWMRDIAKALRPIHAKGHWHRDLKPSNILLFRDASGNIIAKITDFGLAPKSDNSSGTMTNSPYGTKGYIDPMARIFGVTSHSDIFSLGRTLRELLTGDKDNNVYPTDIPITLRLFVERMLSLNRDDRPTAEAIYQEAQKLLAPPKPVQPTIPLPQNSGKGIVAALAGLAALFVIGNSNTWDEKAGRYRNSRGQYASGWLG